MAHCLQNSTKLLKKLREQREKKRKKEKKRRKKCGDNAKDQPVHLHWDCAISITIKKAKCRPHLLQLCPRKPVFCNSFISFTTLPWTCAHIQLKSTQESQILSQFPLCSSRWLSMLTQSILPGAHFPCKYTTDYLRWLRLWFCGRCRNNVAPKWHAIFIQRDHGCPVVIMKVSRQFQWEHMNFCNKIWSVKFHFKDSLVLSHILSIFQWYWHKVLRGFLRIKNPK